MVRKVDLDENAHALTILQRLDQMKRDQRQCDFIVSAEGNEVHAHRNILSVGSDYFNAMLTHDTKESLIGKVEMMDVDSECVRICIDYIYTGKADIPDGKILALMHVSRLMQLDELFGGIVTLFENDLNVDTFYEAKEVAELYGLENLLTKCKEFADENFSLISSQPDFLNEPKKFVFDTISSKNLSATEEEKLIVSLKWMRHDPERAKHFPDFVQAIDLKNVPVGYRRHLLEKESLVTINPHLLQIFYTSIMDSMEIQSRNREEFYDNEVVIIFDENTDGLQSFSIQNEEMSKFHDGDVKRFWPFSAACLRSHIYVLSKDKSVHRLSISDDKANWVKMENMMEDHGSYPPVVSHDGSLYVIGGSHEYCTAVSEQYLPDENKWVRLKDLPKENQYAAIVSLDEYIYIAGGFMDEKCCDTFLRFSPFKSEWTDLPPMIKARECCGIAAANKKVYVMGGKDGDEADLADVECFDVVTSQWMTLAPMAGQRCLFEAFCIKKFIYVFGLNVAEGGGNLIEKYDMEKDAWEEVKVQRSTRSISYAILPRD